MPRAFTQFPITADFFSPEREVMIVFETSKAAIFISGIDSGDDILTPFLMDHEISACERISFILFLQPGTITTLIPLSWIRLISWI